MHSHIHTHTRIFMLQLIFVEVAEALRYGPSGNILEGKREGRELKVIRSAHKTPLSAMVVSSSADIAGTVGSGDYELCKLWPFP